MLDLRSVFLCWVDECVFVLCLRVCGTYWISCFRSHVQLRKVCCFGSEERSPCWFSGMCVPMLCLWVVSESFSVVCLSVLGVSGVCVLALKGVCLCWVLSGVFPYGSEECVHLCWFLKRICSEWCVCLCVCFEF